MCSTTVPYAVPDMRASEIRTMSVTPCFRIFAGSAKLPTSGNPGYPLGPQFLSTSTQDGSTSSFGSSMRRLRSSMSSNTTARPLCRMSFGVAAEGLNTAPSGARLPRRTAIPPCGLNGLPSGVMTFSL